MIELRTFVYIHNMYICTGIYVHNCHVYKTSYCTYIRILTYSYNCLIHLSQWHSWEHKSQQQQALRGSCSSDSVNKKCLNNFLLRHFLIFSWYSLIAVVTFFPIFFAYKIASTCLPSLPPHPVSWTTFQGYWVNPS